MHISPRIIAIATIGLGALTFGALMSEARSSNIRPLNLSTMRALMDSDVAEAPQDVAAPQETVFMSSSTGSQVAVTLSEPVSASMLLPADAPEAPALPQPGRLAQATGATTTMTDQPLSPFGLPCGLSVTTTASDGAVVALDIMDPCQPHSRVIIEHSGLNLPETPLLLLEFHGSEGGAVEQAETFGQIAEEFGGTDFAATSTTEERNKLWQARQDMSWACLHRRPGARGKPEFRRAQVRQCRF